MSSLVIVVPLMEMPSPAVSVTAPVPPWNEVTPMLVIVVPLMSIPVPLVRLTVPDWP